MRHLTPITVLGPPGHDVFLFIIITNKNKMGLLLAKYKLNIHHAVIVVISKNYFDRTEYFCKPSKANIYL